MASAGRGAWAVFQRSHWITLAKKRLISELMQKNGDDLGFELKIAEANSTTSKQAFRTFDAVKAKSLSIARRAKQWLSTIGTYVFPKIGKRPVAEINSGDNLKILAPIRSDKPEPARRVLEGMEAIFNSAIL